LKALGGSLFDTEFCGLHSGNLKLCNNSVDCSSRSLWKMIQITVDRLLEQVTLQDLVGTEKESSKKLVRILKEHVQ
jgi:Rrf2 family iron-sulfur cluster assembly transcriptional regulator